MINPILAIATLFAGPWIYGRLRGYRALLESLNGAIFVIITGLVVIGILPESLQYGGWISLLFVLLGLVGPELGEAIFKPAAHRVHLAALVFGILGLIVHAGVDGAALNETHTHGGYLSLAVILHRLPVGIMVWWLLWPRYGAGLAAAVLIAMGVSTAGGYLAAPLVLGALSTTGFAWFQAFVAGAILHVILNPDHFHFPDQQPPRTEKDFLRLRGWAEGIGSLVGLGILIFVLTADNHGLVSNDIGSAFMSLALQSAPALLFAYVIAGVIRVFMPETWVDWMSRGRALSQAFRGMIIGLPLPICSCGVLPVYQSLTQRGVPAAAGLAFLVATPELGIAALFLSIPLLGWDMTAVRIAGAVALALLLGLALGPIAKNRGQAHSCCASNDAEEEDTEAFAQKLRRSMQEGLGEFVDRTAPWILLGVAVAAIMQTHWNIGWLETIPQGMEVLLLAALGLPFYVCASGATPLVAVLLLNGVSPGAALAFLLTGPASNIATFGVLGQLHGRRFAVLFGLLAIAGAVILGYIVNAVTGPEITSGVLDVHDHKASLLEQISLIGLLLLFLASVLRRGARGFIGEIFNTHGHAHTDPAHEH